MNEASVSIEIQEASPQDLPEVYALIKELALFENEPNEPTVSLATFIENGTATPPAYHVLTAKSNDILIGIALYYLGYSTWKGRMLYLDDLVVKEAYRGKGIGKKLIHALIQKGKELNVNQIRWQVLDWNKDAIAFYEKIPVNFDAQWINCKLEKDFLDKYK